jgi:hypothetical protein
VTDSDERRTKTRQLVAELVAGYGLQVRELPGELVITNPRDPDKGQVHVDLTDGYVSLERMTWAYWGTLAGLPDVGEGLVSGRTILDTLLGRLHDAPFPGQDEPGRPS